MSDLLSLRDTILLLKSMKKCKMKKSRMNSETERKFEDHHTYEDEINITKTEPQIPENAHLISETYDSQQTKPCPATFDYFSDKINEAWENEKEEIDQFEFVQPGNKCKGNQPNPTQKNKQKSEFIKQNGILKEPKVINASETGNLQDSAEPKALFCLCQREAFGDMVACDNQDCPMEWFHFACMRIKEKPVGVWFCPPCLTQKRKKKSRKKVTEKHVLKCKKFKTKEVKSKEKVPRKDRPRGTMGKSKFRIKALKGTKITLNISKDK
eukprot:TRINITY_DN37617_c0_g1_i1.p1 TRINITY_DN37617_c0_g1~~TRINITY_DN37617_c0_g1_i1.p1  ORF type:complete len:268 (-),score=68.89 TRINITY_DN37617_c0_g1_i1:293-1096(-)